MKTSRTLALLCFVSGFAWLGAAEAPVIRTKLPTDFRTLDTNNDGRLSLAEFTAPAAKAREASRAKAKEQPKPDAPVPKHDEIVPGTDSVEGRYSPEVFAQLDVNHDDSLSPKELMALVSDAHNISQP